MSDTTQIVFIVDDDPDIRSSLLRALRIRGFEAQAFASAAEFLEVYDSSQIGCLILDQGMPDMTGLELQQHLKEKGCAIPIIFITGHGGVPESVQAMKGGAVDFLEKPFRQSELIECIQNALSMAEVMHATIEKNRILQERLSKLTPREKEIVNHMLSRPSEVSSKEIGRHLNISPRTVDNHRARILEKLEIGSVVELVSLTR
ncbi:response regulator transcription factor [Paracoccus saliphilus]|uniref:Response regulator transcription factor n=1 Tax=Paracoccus saliphilus TaxID=405559 RepID=A0AA46A5D3_9RHOB|nr:response regulator [Paracoccus saliphilus]WCR02599.1 response regulator transcription factor [Paracoccus saliphilus]SIS77978.1 two component transcriptional regulator, LuxR family [Paracoccus saliphilus]